jgi:hypothetical protein
MKTYPNATLSTPNPTRTSLAANLSFHGEKPATNCLFSGTVYFSHSDNIAFIIIMSYCYRKFQWELRAAVYVYSALTPHFINVNLLVPKLKKGSLDPQRGKELIFTQLKFNILFWVFVMLLLQKHMARTNTPHIMLLLITITSTHHTTRFLLCAVLSCYLLL